MKATGVVRRIDELGRIVIPKEIRKTMHIREGENIEIFIEGEQNIVLKKYSAVKKLDDFASRLTDAIYAFLKYNVIITDTDSIVAISGPLKKELNGESLSEDMINAIKRRESILEKNNKKITITNNHSYEGSYVIHSIVSDGDVVGLVILLSTEDKIGEVEEKIAHIASQFLAKYLEE